MNGINDYGSDFNGVLNIYKCTTKLIFVCEVVENE